MGTLNKDQVFEAVTNADGIATFSYTQYAAGTDEVVAYPTGAPTVRSHAYVFWGVDTILSIEPTDKKGNSVNNGEDKTYKLTYLDPKTGKPVANKKFNVTFAENVNVNINQTSKASVNGVNPRQLLNNETPVVATVTTDGKGEAIFTVSGQNTEVTPIVFEDDNSKTNTTYEGYKLQAKAETVKFGAIQADYIIDVTRDGAEEAAVGPDNGREYTVVLKTKDGKVAANEIVNVALNENLDRNINTNTKAKLFAEYDANDNPKLDDVITVKTDKDGKATFTVVSNIVDDYATPIVWIDINSADARDGKLDEGEPNKVAPITYFAEEKLSGGVLTAAKTPGGKKAKEFTGVEPAYFTFSASNQSGNPFKLDGSKYDSIDATFTVTNTGSNYITVNGDNYVAPNRSVTIPVKGQKDPYITVTSGNDTATNLTTSVKVVAYGTAVPVANSNARLINLGSHTAEANFTSTTALGTIHTGIVTKIDTDKKRLTFEGKAAISYDNATYKNTNAVTIKQDAFEDLVKNNLGKAKVTYKKDGDNVTFEIVSLDGNVAGALTDINRATNQTDMVAALTKHGDTFSPKFSTLKSDDQKANVANALLSAKALTGALTDSQASSVYAMAFDKEVTDSIEAFKASKTPANLKLVPGLDLSKVAAADEAAVVTKLGSFTGKTLNELQAAVTKAVADVEAEKANAETDAALEALNTAADKAAMKTALKANAAALKLDITNLTDEQVTFVADALFANSLKGSYNAVNVKSAFADAAKLATDATAPTVKSVEISADGTTLTLTFDEAVQGSDVVAKADYTFKDADGATVTVADAAATLSGDKVVITLTTEGLEAGHTLTSLTLKTTAGDAVKVTDKSLKENEFVFATAGYSVVAEKE